jgi:uncharacterized protein YjbI with pentapeptide repeats
MKQEELNEVLRLHRLYIKGYTSGVRANLIGADLSGANLSGADLSGAYLRNANLSDANLSDANLSRANLSRANLSCACLLGADLRDANLHGCIGNSREIKTIQCEYWNVVYTKDVIQIGCENHSIEEWFNFTDDEIAAMNVNALTFWNKYKDVIRMMAIDEVTR